VTGHGTKVAAMHQRSLARFEFDTVLLPYSYSQMQNIRYASDFSALVQFCRKRNVAVQTIKSIARRPWQKTIKTHNTYFYEPLTTQTAIDAALHWALDLAGSFVITAGDMGLVPKILDAASRFEKCPSGTEMNAITKTFNIQPIFK
jgi:hypothetical protein